MIGVVNSVVVTQVHVTDVSITDTCDLPCECSQSDIDDMEDEDDIQES
jgi:hypothetical protein